MCILVQLQLDYGQFSNKRRILRCGVLESGTYSDVSAHGVALILGTVLIRGNTVVFSQVYK